MITIILSNHPVAKAADTGSKRLISLAPDAWVQWVTQRPDVVAKEILGSEFQWISRLLAFFTSFVLDTPLVQQIMRWDMAVLRESPWYQEILTEGEQRGRERGLQQGLQQGVQQGARRQLMRVLQLRFGEIPQQVQARLEHENLEQLESLMDAAIAVSSLDEFLKIMSI